MYRYLYYFLLIIAFTLVQTNLFGQSWQGKRVKSMPKVYMDPGPTGEEAPENATSSNELWKVYSDRDNNACYSNPNGSKTTTISFMQQCYVIDEQGDYLELIEFDNTVIDISGKIKRDPTYYGWVPKSKLLLWNIALIDRKTHFPIKALVGHTVSSLKKEELIRENKSIPFCNSPSIQTRNRQECRFFQFLYVYKTEGDFSLLGSTQLLTSLLDNTNKTTILGWVPNDLLQMWTQRFCIAPNRDNQSSEQRKSSGTKTTVWSDKKDAENAQRGTKSASNKVLWDKDEYDKQPDNSWYRLPVFDRTPEGIVRTGVVTGIYNSSGDNIVSEDNANDLRNDANLALNTYRNTNLIFVIDGTNSMGIYFPAAVQAIRNSIKTFEDKNINFKVGVVVYRDYVERKCSRGDLLTQVQPLGGAREAMSFLTGIHDRGEVNDCLDKDAPEAMFHGIYTASSLLNGHSKENNVVILIGDTGNRIPDEEGHTTNECASLLAMNNCSFLAYQVQKKERSEAAYDAFVVQTRDIMQQLMASVHSKIRTSTGNSFAPSMVDGNTIGSYHYINSAVEGTLRFSDLNAAISPANLQTEVEGIVEKTQSRLLNIIDEGANVVNGLGERPKNVNPAVWLVLSNMGVDTKLVEKFADKNFQLFLEGYTTLKTNSVADLYQYELFMKDDELNQMIVDIQQLLAGGNGGQMLTERLTDMCKKITTKYVGSDAQDAIDDMTIPQLWEYVTGLPPSKTSCGLNTRVKDIPNLDMKEVEDIFTCMNERHEKLKQLQRDKTYYFATAYGYYYYWIPQSVMP